MKIDGNNPTILYGYGGFGISMQPFFDVNNILIYLTIQFPTEQDKFLNKNNPLNVLFHK